MTRAWKAAVVSMGGLSVAAAAFFAGRSSADGIPTTASLSYTGTLETPDGELLSGEHNLELKLWDAPADGKNPLCTTSSQSVALEQGRFSLALPDDCARSVQSHQDVWVEVLLDGGSLGRAKVGAVPYAIEAGRAVRAASAERLGMLAPEQVQVRVSTACVDGSSIRQIKADGTVECETDDNLQLTEAQVDAYVENNIAVSEPVTTSASDATESCTSTATTIGGNWDLCTIKRMGGLWTNAEATNRWCDVRRVSGRVWEVCARTVGATKNTISCEMTCLRLFP